MSEPIGLTVWLTILTFLMSIIGALVALLWKGHDGRLEKLESKDSERAKDIAGLTAHRDFANSGIEEVKGTLRAMNDKLDAVLIAVASRKAD